MKFPPKAITIYSEEKVGFYCKNNPKCGKLANFRLDTISKINFKTLVVMLYSLQG